MKRCRSRLALLCTALGLVCLLSGCTFSSSAEELFTLPKFPVEYTGLSEQLNELLARGYEYASPSGGRNIQSVQMVDLDGDGCEEALAFFRDSSAEKPLKIVVFRSTDDSFEQLCTIESSGTTINRISYQDLNGDGVMELVVGWRISADVQTLAVYAVGAEPEVLLQSSYHSFVIEDLDGNGTNDLLVLRADKSGASVLDCFRWLGDVKPTQTLCSLSSTTEELSAGSVVTGMLEEGTPALFVTGVNSRQQAVTDVILWQEEKLVNAAADRGGRVSQITANYQQWRPQDINHDGLVEIPQPRGTAQDRSGDDVIDWVRCSRTGELKTVDCTYHSLSGGWYFRLPQSWWGRITCTQSDSGSNESQVTLQVGGEPVAALYTIVGENRESRALRGNRFVLRRQTGVIYAGELLSGSGSWDVDEAFLRQNFNLAVSAWNTGEN